MFPIICLSCQIEAVNHYITRFKLSKEAVYSWLTNYGELVKPHEDSKLRNYPMMPTTEQNPPVATKQGILGGYHIYRTVVGFLNVFQIAEFNQIRILVWLQENKY